MRRSACTRRRERENRSLKKHDNLTLKRSEMITCYDLEKSSDRAWWLNEPNFRSGKKDERCVWNVKERQE